MNIISTINYYDRSSFLQRVEKNIELGVGSIRVNLCKFNKEKLCETIEAINELHDSYFSDTRLIYDLPYPYKDMVIIYGDGEGAFVVEKIEDAYMEIRALKDFEIGKTKSISPEIVKYELSGIKNYLSGDNVFFALSFVHDEKEIKEFREVCDKSVKVIAKIETKEALSNIENIAEASDGLMIARGDLGITDNLGLYTDMRNIVKCGKEKGKEILTATDYLLSLEDQYLPKKSETIDLAYAIDLECDSIVLKDGCSNLKMTMEYIKNMEQTMKLRREKK